MRFRPQIIAVGLAAFALAAPVAGQQGDQTAPQPVELQPRGETPTVGRKSDDQIAPRSIELQKRGEAHLAADRLNEAVDALETALAVDPRNRAAFVGLARVAAREKLFGKAIRLTNRALLLDPNDRSALAVQGEAMVELGASARAQTNLQKLKTLCPQGCPQLSALSSLLSRGPAVASAKPVETSKTN
jgi:tetratricopeptide (TPR) repeat protein